MPSHSNVLTSAPRKRRRVATLSGSTLTGAGLLARARKGDFGRNIDMAAVERAYATRRRRVRAG